MTREIIPLGVSAATPTRNRNLASLALRYDADVLIFDAGEGTQFQLMRFDIKTSHIRAIFISHMHGDHFFGLPGLLASLAMNGRRDPLYLFGPAGIKHVLDTFNKASGAYYSYDLIIQELTDENAGEIIFETPVYQVKTWPINHRVKAFGYRFDEKQRPGRMSKKHIRRLGIVKPEHFKALFRDETITLNDGTIVKPSEVIGPPRDGVSFAYCTDTSPCENTLKLADKVSMLYHEATFTHDLAEQAQKTGHSTAKEAGETAQKASAGQLLITHFSARYGETKPLVLEARTVFPKTWAAYEGRPYKLRHPE